LLKRYLFTFFSDHTFLAGFCLWPFSLSNHNYLLSSVKSDNCDYKGITEKESKKYFGKQLLIANNGNRVRGAVLCLLQDGACTDLFENLSLNSLKGDLSNHTTSNYLFSHWSMPLITHHGASSPTKETKWWQLPFCSMVEFELSFFVLFCYGSTGESIALYIIGLFALYCPATKDCHEDFQVYNTTSVARS
jgi:hypothetical protein